MALMVRGLVWVGLVAARVACLRLGSRNPVTTTTMSAVSPGSKVLVLGSGPMSVLASKTSAAMGYETLLLTSTPELAQELLWLDAEAPVPSNPRLLDPTNEADVAAFDGEVLDCRGVVVAYDSERTLSDKLLDLIFPEGSKIQRLCLMSRHLNGAGNGPLATASKLAANKEVWALSKTLEAQYRDFEARVNARAAKAGADVVTVRAGTIKGGGPGSTEAADERGGQTPTLTRAFYARCIQRDLVNWQLIFDCDTQGVALTKGDTAPGPGFRAVFTSTSAEAEPGDSGRVGLSQALIRCLSHPRAGGAEFGVTTRQGRQPPSDDDWANEFDKVFV